MSSSPMCLSCAHPCASHYTDRQKTPSLRRRFIGTGTSSPHSKGASKWCPSDVTQCVVSSRDGHRESRVIGVSPRRSTRVHREESTLCTVQRGNQYSVCFAPDRPDHHRLARDAPVTTSHELQASGLRDMTMTANPIAIRSYLPPNRPWPRRRLARLPTRTTALPVAPTSSLMRHRLCLGSPSSRSTLAALARRLGVKAWCEARPLTLCELSLPGLCVSLHFQGDHTTCDVSLCVTSRVAIIGPV